MTAPPVESFARKASATVPEASREALRGWWDPSRQLIRTIRSYQSARGIWRKLYVWPYRFWSAVTGADIPLNSQIGVGFMMPHPNGIVIHPGAIIGCNCLFFQQVTIAGRVQIGGHVDIGAGAKIIGPLTIGDHVRIGANAVVTSDVASGTTMVGIPARPLSDAASVDPD